jgi:hypothetical protein
VTGLSGVAAWVVAAGVAAEVALEGEEAVVVDAEEFDDDSAGS